MSILGAWKLLGVIVILAPGYPLVKEWAYAGFFVAMTGAVISHMATAEMVSPNWWRPLFFYCLP